MSRSLVALILFLAGLLTASGAHSTATCDSTIVSGAQSVALGRFTMASSAQAAFAMGDNSAAP